MARRAFRIAYDGTDYHGYQRQPQPDVPTVEDVIFDALRELAVLEDDADKPAGYAAAGRTDAGVSALAQTIALEAPDWLAPRALNGRLPADVRAWAAADAPPDFHATHHATRREYTYHLYAPLTETDGAPAVDDDRFRAACEALSGTHDVANLTPDDHNTERSLSLAAERDGDYLVLTVAAGGFSRELVRRLVSLARAVGTGDAPREKIDRVLEPEPLPGHEGIAPAPPEPLVLTDVSYPALEFEIDEEAAESARAVFGRRRIDRRTGARVAGQLADGTR
ncbi:tRNA pseudouridine(38,39,40) synthase TruA [Natrinema saccharevitans]|uniref:tRNA pseudouridine synthase A n=1 Tax=Natrinema saccharevitans TaxID=301967 RepID=A0A1S8ARY3_9EURY|nr:tRNA pseudouridine(38-40) synthase TruA [Natrinema saccharevitans]OLZ39573.1 tRNA pseudouridine(38,39,40) synthase TruA [Natrinema saccharevitans]